MSCHQNDLPPFPHPQESGRRRHAHRLGRGNGRCAGGQGREKTAKRAKAGKKKKMVLDRPRGAETRCFSSKTGGEKKKKKRQGGTARESGEKKREEARPSPALRFNPATKKKTAPRKPEEEKKRGGGGEPARQEGKKNASTNRVIVFDVTGQVMQKGKKLRPPKKRGRKTIRSGLGANFGTGGEKSARLVQKEKKGKKGRQESRQKK